jgi:hypothetical protein
VHGWQRLCFQGCTRLLRITGAGCCILERYSRILLRAPLERVACAQQFSSVNVTIRVNTQAAIIDGTMEGRARNTCDTGRVTDGEFGHGVRLTRRGR